MLIFVLFSWKMIEIQAVNTSMNCDMVSLLINSGADIFARNRYKQRLLDIAEEFEKHDIVALLESHAKKLGFRRICVQNTWLSFWLKIFCRLECRFLEHTRNTSRIMFTPTPHKILEFRFHKIDRLFNRLRINFEADALNVPPSGTFFGFFNSFYKTC